MSKDAPDIFYEEVNLAYWRTCSLLLAAVINNAFVGEINVRNVEVLPYTVEHGCFGLKVTNKRSKW